MHTQRMVRGLKWSVLGRGVSQGLAWIMSLITIRLLQPEDFGLIALCESVIVFIAFSNELGLGAAIIQNDRLERREQDAMSTFFLLWNGTLYLLLYAAAPLAAAFYRAPDLTLVLRVLGLNLIILSFAVVPRSLLIRELRFKGLTLVKAGASLLGGAIAVAGAVRGHGVWALVVGSLSLSLIETVGYHWVQRMWPRFGLAFGLLRRHFRFGAAVMAQRVIWLAYMKADIFVVGRLFDTRTTGLYAVGRELATLPLDRIGSAINQVVFAGFARIKDDRAAVGHLFIRGIGLLCFMSFPVFFGISAVAEPMVLTLLGSPWAASALVAALMALTGPLRLVNTVSVEILNAVGAARDNLRQVTYTGLLVVAGIAVGVQWGILGLCVGWLAGYLAGAVLHVLCLSRHVPIDRRVARAIIARPLLGCGLMYGVVLGVLAGLAGEPAWLRLAAGVLAGAAAYGAWALLVMRSELRTLRATVAGRA
jgi:O-antigen/teichoic acid export membrane protein